MLLKNRVSSFYSDPYSNEKNWNDPKTRFRENSEQTYTVQSQYSSIYKQKSVTIENHDFVSLSFL